MLSPNPSAAPWQQPQRQQASQQRASSTTRRAGSGERAQDPVLARYLSIKKELEAAGALQTRHQQLSDTAQPSSQPTTPRTRIPSLWSAPLTPIASSHVSPPATNRGVSDDERRRQQKVEAENQLLRRSEARRATEQSERTELIQRCTELERLRSSDSDTISLLEQQVAALTTELQNSNDARAVAERTISTAERELAALRQAHTALEMTSRAADRSSGTARVLEGKVEALSTVVAQHAGQLEEEQRRTNEVLKQLEAERAETDRLSKLLRSKEREAGEISVENSNAKQELEKAKRRAEDAAVSQSELERAVARLEEQLRNRTEELEKTNQRLKDEQRSQSKMSNTLEMELCASAERQKELEAAKQRLESELANTTSELRACQQSQKDLSTKLESMKVLSAQESIVADERKYEIDRCKKLMNELREELQAQEETQENMENMISELEKDRRVKMALEEQLRVLQASMDRQAEDYNVLRAHHNESVRRLGVAEEEANQLLNIQNKLAEAEAMAEGKQLTIEKLFAKEKALKAEIDELRGEVASKSAEADSAKRDFIERHEECEHLLERCRMLEGELKDKIQLHGKLEALHRALEEKQAEATRLQVEVSAWQGRCREMDGDIETLLGVRGQFEEVLAVKGQIVAELEEKTRTIEAHERAAQALQMTIRQKEEEIHDCVEINRSLEAQISRQAAQLSDRAQMETRLRQLTNELALKGEELQRERERRDELQARVAAKEDAVETERTRRSEVEKQLLALQQEQSKLQVDVGRQSVTLEAIEREKSRLLSECEQKGKQVTSMQEELSKTRRELNTKEAELDQMSLRVRLADDRSSSQSQATDDAQKELLKSRASIAGLEATLRDTEDRLRAALSEADRERAGSSRAAEAEMTLRRRESELQEAASLVGDLREKNKSLQIELDAVTKAAKRVGELEQQLSRQSAMIASLDSDDSAKSKQLLEKERELGRAKERVTALESEIDSERQRRKQFEMRVKELESECQRASALDGQVAGLNMVIAQRTQDLEAERQQVNELRAKLRSSERRSVSVSQSASIDVEAKLRVKDDTIAQLEQEEKRRQGVVEQLKREIDRLEAERKQQESTARELRMQLEKTDAMWLHKYHQLEAAVEGRRMDSDGEKRLAEEMTELKRRLADANHSLLAKDRQIESLQRVQSRGGISAAELEKELRESEHLRNRAQQLLHEKEVQLSIASENISTLEKRLREPSASVRRGMSPISSGLRLSLDDNQIALSAEEEIRRWRERRREQAAADTAKAQNYELAMRRTSPPQQADGN